MVGYFAQLLCHKEGLGPASIWYASLCPFPKGGLTPMRIGCGGGGGREVGKEEKEGIVVGM